MGHGTAASIAVDKTRHAQARALIIAREDAVLPILVKVVEVTHTIPLEIDGEITHIPCTQFVVDSL
jgi:hypothetical protein